MSCLAVGVDASTTGGASWAAERRRAVAGERPSWISRFVADYPGGRADSGHAGRKATSSGRVQRTSEHQRALRPAGLSTKCACWRSTSERDAAVFEHLKPPTYLRGRPIPRDSEPGSEIRRRPTISRTCWCWKPSCRRNTQANGGLDHQSLPRGRDSRCPAPAQPVPTAEQ